MSAIEAAGRAATKPKRPPAAIVFLLLGAVLIAAITLAASQGAAGIPLRRLLAALGLVSPSEPALLARDHLVIWSIRAPRVVIAAIIGALLAASGAIMQGLFRNPLADPTLVGVSSGGALAAASTIVLMDSAAFRSVASFQFEALPLAAFFGALASTYVLYRLASRNGRTSVALFLLSGLAIAALANAGIGLLVFVADDRQLRDITFWMLGSLAGSTWPKVWAIAPIALVALAALPFIARDLDLLVLGEAEAFHAGINVQRLKVLSVVLISAMTGAAVAVAGVIGFAGIITPHLLRLVIGPGHRMLLPCSALLGAALMIGADTAARTIAAPAEVPIGILTAAIGAPFFLFILLRRRLVVDL